MKTGVCGKYQSLMNLLTNDILYHPCNIMKVNVARSILVNAINQNTR